MRESNKREFGEIKPVSRGNLEKRRNWGENLEKQRTWREGIQINRTQGKKILRNQIPGEIIRRNRGLGEKKNSEIENLEREREKENSEKQIT